MPHFVILRRNAFEMLSPPPFPPLYFYLGKMPEGDACCPPPFQSRFVVVVDAVLVRVSVFAFPVVPLFFAPPFSGIFRFLLAPSLPFSLAVVVALVQYPLFVGRRHIFQPPSRHTQDISPLIPPPRVLRPVLLLLLLVEEV